MAHAAVKRRGTAHDPFSIAAPVIVRDGPAPPRYVKPDTTRRKVEAMGRGQWVQVSRSEARRMQEVARELGGVITIWKVSEAFYCAKVLEAPWMAGLDVEGVIVGDQP